MFSRNSPAACPGSMVAGTAWADEAKPFAERPEWRRRENAGGASAPRRNPGRSNAQCFFSSNLSSSTSTALTDSNGPDPEERPLGSLPRRWRCGWAHHVVVGGALFPMRRGDRGLRPTTGTRLRRPSDALSDVWYLRTPQRLRDLDDRPSPSRLVSGRSSRTTSASTLGIVAPISTMGAA